MARKSLIWCLILIVIFHLFWSSEPRLLYAYNWERDRDRNRDEPNQYGAVLKGVKGNFKISWENQETDPSQYQPARVSPGGPDPKHHL